MEKIAEGSEPFGNKIFGVKFVQIVQRKNNCIKLTKMISEGSEPFGNKIFGVKIVQIA